MGRFGDKWEFGFDVPGLGVSGKWLRRVGRGENPGCAFWVTGFVRFVRLRVTAFVRNVRSENRGEVSQTVNFV